MHGKMFLRFSLFFLLLIIFFILSTCNSDLTLDIDDTIPPNFTSDIDNVLSISARATAASVSWIKAVDNLTEQDELEYRVFYSLSGNISEAADVEKNGTAANEWTSDIDTFDVTELTITTDYYFNVLVRDKAGNTTAYTSAETTTKNDNVIPIPGGAGSVEITSKGMEELTIAWEKGTDDLSPQSTLEYLVYFYASSEESIDNKEIISNGTAFDTWAADISSKQVTGLIDNTQYHVTVAVRDEVGNENLYGTDKETLLFWVETLYIDISIPKNKNVNSISLAFSLFTDKSMNPTFYFQEDNETTFTELTVGSAPVQTGSGPLEGENIQIVQPLTDGPYTFTISQKSSSAVFNTGTGYQNWKLQIRDLTEPFHFASPELTTTGASGAPLENASFATSTSGI